MTYKTTVRFEVVTEAVMWSAESQQIYQRNISPPSSGRRIRRARKKRESRWQRDLLAEDGDDMFLQNIC